MVSIYKLHSLCQVSEAKIQAVPNLLLYYSPNTIIKSYGLAHSDLMIQKLLCFFWALIFIHNFSHQIKLTILDSHRLILLLLFSCYKETYYIPASQQIFEERTGLTNAYFAPN